MPQPKTTARTLYEPAQSKRMSRFHKNNFIRKFTGKMPQPETTAQTLCERGQPKRTSRFHKRHFIRKFTGKMPRSRSPERTQNADTRFVRAWAVETHVKISQETLYTEIYRKNAGAQSEHPDQAPAFTRTVRTPQCRPTVWGIKYELYNQY